jgi:hypothetical protein
VGAFLRRPSTISEQGPTGGVASPDCLPSLNSLTKVTNPKRPRFLLSFITLVGTSPNTLPTPWARRAHPVLGIICLQPRRRRRAIGLPEARDWNLGQFEAIVRSSTHLVGAAQRPGPLSSLLPPACPKAPSLSPPSLPSFPARTTGVHDRGRRIALHLAPLLTRRRPPAHPPLKSPIAALLPS